MKIRDNEPREATPATNERGKLRFAKETLLNLTVKTSIRAGIVAAVPPTTDSVDACCT
jgi:hypothetical protein